MISYLLRLSLLSLFALPCVFAQVAGEKSIPRDRLLTDTELLSLTSLPDASRRAMEEGDIEGALRFLVDDQRIRPLPRYFFSPREVPSRVSLFRSRHPGTAEKAVRQAGEFFQTFGSDVDWRVPGKDRTGKAHTPNTVRLLARQWQAENIALRYYLNGEEKSCIDFLMAHVRDFVSDFESGKTETGGNDIFERFYGGHRARNWMMMHRLLQGTEDYRWQDQVLMLKVFLLHAGKLYDGARKFSWGNHQLVGLTGLFEVTLMFPEFPVMRSLNAHALRLINEHMEKEIASDGFQFERASHYFKLDIVNYFRVYRLCELNGIELPKLFHERFRKMFEVIPQVAMPNRSLPPLQDAQDTYVTGAGADDARSGVGEARSSNAAELAEPGEDVFLSLGALLFNEPSFKYFARSSFPPAFFWMMDTNAADRFKSLKQIPPSIGSVGLPETKYYVMRSGWDADARYMVIDGGLAHDKPDHTHGGILGVVMYAYGQGLLPNYRVKYSHPDYIHLKNSLVKNVALVDTILQGQRWKPNAAGTGFGFWQKLPVPTVKTWWTGDSFDYFEGSHNGFDTISVDYSRRILFIKPDYWVFWDAFQSEKPHSAQQIWHGAFSAAGDGVVVRSEGKAHVAIAQADPSNMSVTLHSVAGTNSVWFEQKSSTTPTYMTFVFPSKGDTPLVPQVYRSINGNVVTTTCSAQSFVTTFTEGNGSRWEDEGCSTDATLTVRHSEGGKQKSMLFLNVSVVRIEKSVVNLQSRTTLEWTKRNDGKWNVRCVDGDPGTIRLRVGSTSEQVIAGKDVFIVG